MCYLDELIELANGFDEKFRKVQKNWITELKQYDEAITTVQHQQSELLLYNTLKPSSLPFLVQDDGDIDLLKSQINIKL